MYLRTTVIISNSDWKLYYYSDVFTISNVENLLTKIQHRVQKSGCQIPVVCHIYFLFLLFNPTKIIAFQEGSDNYFKLSYIKKRLNSKRRR